jgi:hypothetical protein
MDSHGEDTMKKMIGAALVAVLLTVPIHGRATSDEGPAGKWRGTISERGRDTLVELELRVAGTQVEGSLAILSETGQEIEKGMTMPIVQGKRTDDRLRFIVPVTGRIDNDALAFELQWQGEELEGTIHEMRPGSRLIPVTFSRKSGPAAPPPPTQASSERRYAIPFFGDLVLQVPDAWKGDLRQPPNDLPPIITFSPAAGAPFTILVTAGGKYYFRPPIRDGNDLRKRVETMARRAGQQSVEKTLEIKKLQGDECYGFYFSATSRAPKAGDYKYLTQGIAAVSEVIMAFNILTNKGRESVVEAALAMLRSGLLRPPPPAGQSHLSNAIHACNLSLRHVNAKKRTKEIL